MQIPEFQSLSCIIILSLLSPETLSLFSYGSNRSQTDLRPQADSSRRCEEGSEGIRASEVHKMYLSLLVT